MPDPPQTLRGARYAVIRVLGEGGQATTLEAVDKQRGSLVAIKRFVVRGAKSWKEVELAEREASVLASISHPSLPRYVEHFEENGELYLVTEKIEGESLAELCRRDARLDEREVMRFLAEAAAALDYLHGLAPPVVHRDIKPSNVIRRPDGSYALIDFGAVRHRMKPEGGSTVVGTFGFMAPEQFQGRAMPASDVYAVGATAIAVLTGRQPEDLPHRGLGIDVPAALAGRRVSPGLARVLGMILEPDPDRRPARLGPLLAGLRGEERRTAAPPRAPRPARGPRAPRARTGRAPGPIPGAVLTVLLLGLGAAQLALLLAMRVFVPMLLTLLSIVFGPPLRRAAAQVSAAGKQAGEALERARRALRGDDEAWRAPAEEAPGAPGRARAAGGVRVDVELEEEERDRAGAEAEEEEQAAGEDAERDPRPRARR